MGWAFCGKDSRGRRIGYGVSARCDEPGCRVQIDRGLGYACGGMHGDGDPEYSCEGYFCGEHLSAVGQRCRRCHAEEGRESRRGPDGRFRRTA